MAPSVKQEPTETMNVAAIEQAVAAMRLMNGIEAKIASESPLSREEINHLYQFDQPMYERTRDDWPHGFYDDEGPELAARLDRYYNAQQSARQSTLETLRKEYGEDADWMFAKYREVSSRVEELLRSGATPTLLAEQLTPADRLKHFELLRAAGVELDARAVYEAFKATDRHQSLPYELTNAFIARYADELIGASGISWQLTRASLANVEEGGEEEAIEKLLGLGVEHWDILRDLSAATVEERFQWLLDAGFEVGQLLGRTGHAFALDNFDALFQLDPDALRSLNLNNPTIEDRARYIIALHRNKQPVKELLSALNKGPHYTLKPQYELFLEAGISIDDIVDTFSGDNESLIHMYAPWLMENGANPDAIKAKFSPEGIISIFEALRKAGIQVDLQHYVDQLPASVVMSRRFVLDREEDVEIDYTAQFEAYEYELDMRAAFSFLDAGVDAKKVFAKLPKGSIANDNMINIFVEAGISREEVWKKVDASMQAAAHRQALNDEESTDEAIEAALKALPAKDVEGALEMLLKRPALITALVERLATDGRVDSKMKLLIESGANINLVIGRVSKKYYGLYNEADWLLAQGADASLLYEQIKDKYMDARMLHAFIEKGVPAETVLSHVEPGCIVNNFDELVAYGYDQSMLVKRAMQKPTAHFVIRNIPLLHQRGYSADQLSAHLSSKEVLDNVQELLLAGLSPALAITHAMNCYHISQKSAEEVISQRLGVSF